MIKRLEIKKLFEVIPGQYLPAGLNLREKLWWRFMPGVVINVRWPTGPVVIDQTMYPLPWIDCAYQYTVESTDPNDHYRPWLEKHVGRQKWDWDWGMANNDVTANRLTIKIRRKRAEYATIAAMRWS